MRICFLTLEYPPHVGGAARSAQRLVKGLAQTGFEVVVITAVWPGQSHSTFSEDGVLVYRVPHALESFMNTIYGEDERKPFDIFHGFTAPPKEITAILGLEDFAWFSNPFLW
jgi:hypothetical protein